MYKCRTCELIFDNKKCIRAHCFKSHGQSIGPQTNAKKHRKKFVFKIQVNTPPSMGEDPKTKPMKIPEKILPQISKKPSQIIKCKLCSRTFKYQTSLINHLTVVHKSKVKNRSNPTKSKPFECSICSKRFPDQRKLIHHKKTHKAGNKKNPKLECKTCWKVFRDSKLFKSHIQAHLKNFKCRVCGNESNSKTAFYNHLRKHPEILFKCKICEKLFKTKINLEYHMTLHVVGEDNTTEIIEQEENCHTEDTAPISLQCTICLKEYTSKSSLNKHKIVHTKDRPYKCKLCPKDYQYSSSLTKHKRTHERDEQNISKTVENDIVVD